ncbi:transcriptional regulator, LysR family protein [methanotrophic bacterial endosymbiont of Bathymodiolus sp.]|jgi:DNA-binding transcriptional LysR family regulator|nr:transcriptional regulator, LysR family protein [methanotrophic bacterial endosymbiont of Bathymodiolus sp.]
MDKLKNMQVFCRIVELGTFAAVAREMGVSPMMISKYMRSLESSLGISLVNRKTRQLYVTDLGQAYYRQCKQILEDLNNLESSISQEGKLVKGVLKINTPIDFGGIYMLPVINAYQQQYPDVKVLMSLDNAAVNLRSAQFDIAIVVTDKLDQGVVARKIAQTSLCTYASPAYLQKHGSPKQVDELAEHKCLHYLNTPHADAWVFIQGKERIEIRPKWSFASNNGGALCQAASLGMGIIRSPALSVRRYVQSGELVEILEDYKLPSLSVYATYLQRNYYPAKITTFIDFLVEYFSEK